MEGKQQRWEVELERTGALRRENVIDLATQQSVPNLINSLLRRSLIEKTDGLFFLQPVVMEYVTERFVQQLCTEFEISQLNFLQTHDRLYEGMNIQGATGLTVAQKVTLKTLGAIEY